MNLCSTMRTPLFSLLFATALLTSGCAELGSLFSLDLASPAAESSEESAEEPSEESAEEPSEEPSEEPTEEAAPEPIDVDGDGFTAEMDCDDADAAVHPDVAEECFDGLDNNCDGLVDEADTAACDPCVTGAPDPMCGGVDCLADPMQPGCEPADYCLETDSGMDPLVAGSTSSPWLDHTDECIVEDGIEYVLEGVCDAGSWVAQIECEFGCSEGACHPEPAPEPEPEPEAPECTVEFVDESYTGYPGETITLEWELVTLAGAPVEEVYISFFSGWSPAEYYVSTVVANTGSYELTLPEDLDPELEYHAYVESAEDSDFATAESAICWRYVQVEVVDLQCSVEFEPSSYSGQPGETITLQWELETLVGPEVEEVYISFFSGWGTEYYLSTVVANTGSYELELPEDLDPTLDYDAYVESATDGARSTICWRYAEVVVLAPETEEETEVEDAPSCDDTLFVSAIGPTELEAGAAMPEAIDMMVTFLGESSADVAIELFLSEDLELDEDEDFALMAGTSALSLTVSAVSSQQVTASVADMASVPEESASGTAFVLVRATVVSDAGCEGTAADDFFAVVVSGSEAASGY